MDKNLPVFQLVIDESLTSDLQVDYVALVDRPAIEKSFLTFNKVQLDFAIDNDRHIISGPAMLADVPIYRRDEQMGEFYVVFTKETIFEIVQKFFSKGFNQNFNLMHDPNAKLEGVTVFESFIVDSSRGIKPMQGFDDAKDGSWFISAKVNNEQVWRLIKEGMVKGFSVEGIFQYKKQKMSEHDILGEIQKILAEVAL